LLSSSELQAGDIQLELLTGPLTGIYDPSGTGAMFFVVLAAAGQIERNYIREKTIEGQVIAAAKGNHGGLMPAGCRSCCARTPLESSGDDAFLLVRHRGDHDSQAGRGGAMRAP
jgi:DNA invertase Pin-like site-specific DNA recombinase